MMGQRLSPGMHNGGEADIGAKMLRIARYLLERLRCGFEQKAVDDLLVLVGNGGNLLRQREDRMEILDRQQIRLPCFQPRTCRRALAGGTMPNPATAVGDLLMPTLLAATYVAPEDRRAAAPPPPRHRGGQGPVPRHTPTLATIEVAGVGLAIGLAVAAEDICHLEGRASHARWLSPMVSTPAAAASPAPSASNARAGSSRRRSFWWRQGCSGSSWVGGCVQVRPAR